MIASNRVFHETNSLLLSLIPITKKNLVASQHDIFFFIYDKHKYTQFVTTIWSFYCKNISLTVNRKINGEKGGVAGRRG